MVDIEIYLILFILLLEFLNINYYYKLFDKGMKTLKISEQTALELYKIASKEFKKVLEDTFGESFFKPKEITKIVYDTDSLAAYLKVQREDLFIFDEGTKDAHERYINACNILVKVANVYNQGFVFDWKDTSQYKYLPYKSFCGGSVVVYFGYWYCCLSCFGGFYYKSKELGEKSYNNFTTIWEDYWGVKS